MTVPNPEQTASLLSLMTYSFLDPVVSLANRVPTLTHDQLPPLADYDYAKNLIATSFPVRCLSSCNIALSCSYWTVINSISMFSREAASVIYSLSLCGFFALSTRF